MHLHYKFLEHPTLIFIIPDTIGTGRAEDEGIRGGLCREEISQITPQDSANTQNEVYIFIDKMAAYAN